jgi:hypothetical protein
VLAIVPLALAAVSTATTPPPYYEQGPITSLTVSRLTVQGNGQIPLTCARTSVSPSVGAFKVGDLVMIDCDQGVLARIAEAAKPTAPNPTTSIMGLPNRFATGEPVSGPSLTKAQCASGWNATAPAAARQAIAALSPLGAQVSWGTTTRDSSAGQPMREGPFCQISFVLPGHSARTATVTSFWKHGKPEGWAGFIDRTGASFFLSADETEFSVSATGTLSLH